MHSPATTITSIERGGVTFYSDAKPDIFSHRGIVHDLSVESNNPKRIGHAFVPAALDNLTGAAHTVGRYCPSHIEEESYFATQNITVRHSDFGRVVDVGSFGRSRSEFTQYHPVLGRIGWELDVSSKRITGVPTPRTFQTAMQFNAIPVKLFPHDGAINGVDYLQAFAEGCYPIAAGEEDYFFHDIHTDHAVAVALGGTALSEILAVTAQRMLNRDPSNQSRGASWIDDYTSCLSVDVLSGRAFVAGRYPYPSLDTPSEEVTEQILETMRRNLRDAS